MSLLNIPCIIGAAGNLNVGNCNFNLDAALMNLYIPSGTKIPVSELNVIVATIKEMLQADAKLSRAQILKGMKGVTKANVEVKRATWPNGDEQVTKDERVGREYNIDGDCQNKALAALNKKHTLVDVIHIFEGNVWVGTMTTMPSGELAVKGFSPSELFTSQYDETINETQAQSVHRVIHAKANEWRDRIAFIPEDGDAENLVGMQTIELTWIKNTPQVAGTYQVSARYACGQLNIADDFGTELLSTSLWIVKNQLGNTVTVDGVEVNGNGNFSVELLTTDPDYTAGTRFTLTLALPSVLAAADVVTADEGYFEGTSISFPKS